MAVARAGDAVACGGFSRRKVRLVCDAMPDRLIYHLARKADFDRSIAAASYEGAREDTKDGFMHFSTADQVVESAARHRAGEPDLLLVAVDPDRLGAALRWEAARGGVLFPHLYGPLPLDAVAWTRPLPLDDAGRHRFPSDL
jgi:uncharacterized protein (DUF952 family)